MTKERQIEKLENLKGYKTFEKAEAQAKRISTNPVVLTKENDDCSIEYYALSETETFLYGANGYIELTQNDKDTIHYGQWY